MQIGIKHHYSIDGTAHAEINFAANPQHAVALIELAMQRPGWSDSRVVNVVKLPPAAQEYWIEIAAASN